MGDRKRVSQNSMVEIRKEREDKARLHFKKDVEKRHKTRKEKGRLLVITKNLKR